MFMDLIAFGAGIMICAVCGLAVVDTGCVSDGKLIKMYTVHCPQCGQGQLTHKGGEKIDK